MAELHIKVLMPNIQKVDTVIDRVILPGIEGDFEVLDGHTPLITKLRSGILKIYKNGKPDLYAIHDGFVTVENNEILILSENCENKNEISLDRATQAKERAEKRMSQMTSAESEIDYRRAEIALKKALTRIEILHL
ncbi:MAG: ATP synthase F1 subunit epsilon [Candidatus Cloacimonetes bacterium]|jgi:F-type H+-transporting ATPase subunit epsilon|nr:ATP synthase F1 subunit epsilon [Candidatus Cloacimonadota bacterium]MDD4155124.1 ATP synthase F1 subunit epsilon [Candidatus Cloacimonadota bacterium]